MWILLVTYIGLKAYWLLSFRLGRALEAYSAEALLKLAVWAPLCGVVAWLMCRRQRTSVGRALGLIPVPVRSIGFAAIATVPMAVAAMMLSRKPLNADLVAGSGLIGPFAEELLFRGFLFTLLVRHAGWSVFWAVVVSSLLFGLAHLPSFDVWLAFILRGPDPRSFEVRVFQDRTILIDSLASWSHVAGDWLWQVANYALPYALGGGLFAWVTWRWQSLWPAIVLHALMNFWWDLTTGEHARLDFAIDPMSAAQAISAALIVALTLRSTRVLHPWRFGRIRRN